MPKNNDGQNAIPLTSGGAIYKSTKVHQMIEILLELEFEQENPVTKGISLLKVNVEKEQVTEKTELPNTYFASILF